MTSMQIRVKKKAMTKKAQSRRVNPVSLGRLVFIALVFSLLTFAQGLLWWAGYALLGIILVTLSVRSLSPALPWIASAGELVLALTHTNVIPFGWGMLLLMVSFTMFLVVLGLNRGSRPVKLSAGPYRPPTWVGYPPLHKSAELYIRPNAADNKR